MLVANVSRFGNFWRGLANLVCRKICQEKKEQSVSGNVQIEIEKSMSEKTETCDQARKLNGRRKRSIGLSQSPQRIEEQDNQEPYAANTAGDTGLREAFEIIVVTVIDDFPVVKRFIG